MLKISPLTSINALLTISIISGSLGVLTLKVAWPTSEGVEAFRNTSAFLAWMSVVSVLFAVSPIAAAYGMSVFLKLGKTLPKIEFINLTWFLIALMLSLGVQFYFFREFDFIFPSQEVATLRVRVDAIVISSILAFIPLAIALGYLAISVDKLNPNAVLFTEKYFLFRDYLFLITFFISLLIGLGTLATGAYQHTLQVHADAGFIKDPFPPGLTVIYGAYFSLILIILYLPIELMLSQKGWEYIHLNFPIPSEKPEEWANSYDCRAKAEEWLNLKKQPFSSLSSNLVILTPLLSGLTSYLLPVR
ncbi:hypothetical protein VB780_08355 [Leptolyngbya sp. CCNP1308]|uniref:hypothetical protein n=1 Tax=Leptolyngbya sp. CCNP1308 TaxID=3110255 RepID=UPI002B1FB2A0|nr:hypothetical protein [Leptolyngbya sp. CCNP1308]MEA5448572.1 hypothetical protein [Leptolyngbya sp. CCNP1308]